MSYTVEMFVFSAWLWEARGTLLGDPANFPMRPSSEGTTDVGVSCVDTAASSESTIISILIGRPRNKININGQNG